MIQKRAFCAIAREAVFFYAYDKGGEDVSRFNEDLEKLEKLGFCPEYREILRREHEEGDPVAVHEFVRTVLACCEERISTEE